MVSQIEEIVMDSAKAKAVIDSAKISMGMSLYHKYLVFTKSGHNSEMYTSLGPLKYTLFHLSLL